MATIPQIRSRLLEGFPEKQADLLAHVVIEAHDDLVNRADFHALTTVVGDLAGKMSELADAQKDLVDAQNRTESRVGELADAQKRTESRVGELADAQKRTESRVEELADAQKRTESRVGELADAQKRTESRVGELADAQKRTESRVGKLADAQKRTESRVGELADAQKRTESRVGELADAQKRTESRVGELADAQKRTESRVGELAESQKDLVDAQRVTEGTVSELVETQNRMLIRLDRLDGRSLEQTLFRHLPAYVGRVFRKCRVIEPLDVVESLEGRLDEAELDDLLLTDIFATAKIGERSIHLVVEVSCTAHPNDVERVVRRAAALGKAGIDAIGIVACEAISPQNLAKAQTQGVRVLLDGRLVPEAA